MTAEIAILNRAAVALAADSAVSLTVRGQEKIYNSIDKLFQLTHSNPVGIMIFGGAEYMGIPLETIIKGFRDSKFCKRKNHVIDYADCFFEYLTQEIGAPNDVIEKQISTILANIFYSIRKIAIDEYVKASNTEEQKKIDPKSFLKEKSQEILHKYIEFFKEMPNCQDIDEKKLYNKYIDVAKQTASEIFSDQFDSNSKDVVELAKLILIKDFFSRSHTGFVFAGFGEKEIFPSLHAFNCDGMIGTILKKKKYVEVIIDRNNKGSHIEPFAQKEMVERFLDGIDPEYDEYIQSSMKQTLDEFGKELIESYVQDSSRHQEILSLVSTAVETHLNTFQTKSAHRRQENFRRQVLDMVHYMPKTDLAAMAESLVNLTSIKRRVSAESETVGGPIDVAVISKNDGFIWIRRKHYFSAELNPRYFTNQNNKLQARSHNNEQ